MTNIPDLLNRLRKSLKVCTEVRLYRPMCSPDIYSADDFRALLEHVAEFSWIPGAPVSFRADEWFLAKLRGGAPVILKALPRDFSYDFKTADDTYYKKDLIIAWMPLPNSEYISPLEDIKKELDSLRMKLEIATEALEHTKDIRAAISNDEPDPYATTKWEKK